MLRVGVTGGIGSGKTLVCQVLNRLGVPVYYADLEARRLLNTRPDLINGVETLLGKEAYRDGELDRKYVAGLVFDRPDLLLGLNSMVHPEVRKDFSEWAGRQEGVPYVVEEAALLLESGEKTELDFIVLVDAPVALRMKRILQRDHTDEREVRKRMSNQMPADEARKMADVILVNDELQMLLPQILDLHDKLTNRS